MSRQLLERLISCQLKLRQQKLKETHVLNGLGGGTVASQYCSVLKAIQKVQSVILHLWLQVLFSVSESENLVGDSPRTWLACSRTLIQAAYG